MEESLAQFRIYESNYNEIMRYFHKVLSKSYDIKSEHKFICFNCLVYKKVISMFLLIYSEKNE